MDVLSCLALACAIITAVVSGDDDGGTGKLLRVQIIRSPSIFSTLSQRDSGGTEELIAKLSSHFAKLSSHFANVQQDIGAGLVQRRGGDREQINNWLFSGTPVLGDDVMGEEVDSSESQSAKLIKESLLTILNDYYFGAVEIGTPPQKLYFQFDSGSSSFWVTSSEVNCHKKATTLSHNKGLFKSGQAQGCPQLRKYNHTKSTTYTPVGEQFDIHYGSGLVHGYVSEDAIHIGGSNFRMKFAEATLLSLEFRRSQYDGVIGLGRKAISVDNLPMVVDELKKAGLIERRMYSAYMIRTVGAKPHTPLHGGTLVFGGVDPNHYAGVIQYVPVNSIQYWQFRLHSLTVPYIINGIPISLVNICPDGCNAMPDTGTTSIVGPEADVDRLNEILGAPHPRQRLYGILTELDCNRRHPVVTMGMGHFVIRLTEKTYIKRMLVKSKDGTTRVACISAFLASAAIDKWLFGDSFLQSFYSVFDYDNNRIGFAMAAH